MNTDIIIIGSGPGGYETAVYAARQGLRVVIVEERHVGGTCLNSGCIPTKALVHDAEKAAHKDDGKDLFRLAIRRKNSVVEQLRQGVEALMSQPGITMLHGHGAFKDKHTIVVDKEEVSAKHIIIATGSTAKFPPIPGMGGNGLAVSRQVVSSEELLEMEQLPDRICIVGAGVIGLEMASIFSNFGCEVSIVEYMKECLPTMDQEISRRLRKMMEKRGIKFYLGSAVQRVEDKKVVYINTKKGQEASVEADIILVATGRKPRIKGLNLESVGIEIGKTGIITNDNMQTNLAHIYAIGDVNGRQMLAHAATFQGYRAVNHILGKSDRICLDIMPAAVFTRPEVASVGPTEEQCKAKNISYTSHKTMYRANGRAQATEQTEGFVKLLFDDKERIIACHALGADAAGIVQEISALMNLNVTRQLLSDIVHIHPTLSEIVLDAARH